MRYLICAALLALAACEADPVPTPPAPPCDATVPGCLPDDPRSR